EPERNHHMSQPTPPIGPTGPHPQTYLPSPLPECRKKPPLDNILDLISVEDRKNDAARGFGEARNGRRRTPADLRKTRAARRIDVKTGDRNARLDQPPGIDLTHQPQSDNADRGAGRALRHAHSSNTVRVPCDRAVRAAAIDPRCGLPASLSSSCRTKKPRRQSGCRRSSAWSRRP